MLSRFFFDFSVGVGAFVIGLRQISSFFSYLYIQRTVKKGKGWIMTGKPVAPSAEYHANIGVANHHIATPGTS